MQQKSKFVRAIYSIVFIQVTLTFILSYAASDLKTLNRAFNNIIVIIASYMLLLGCLLVFFLTNISQIYPLNYSLLGLFTLSESVVISGWTSDMSQETIVLWVGMCMITTGILTFKIFTMRESSSGLFYTLVIAVFVQIVLASFLLTISYWKLIAVCFGVLGYGCFIIINTNKISNELPLNEYILGSLLLYIDILTFFIYLLKQFGKKKR
jgi:FtsH-binding integral membrane protein